MNKIVLIVLGILFLAAIAGGFYVVGSPNKAQDLTQDQERVTAVLNLSSAVENYHNTQGELPQSLDRLVGNTYLQSLPKDPKSKKDYEYTKVDDTNYKICAEFATSAQQTTGSDTPPMEGIYAHPKGKYCLEKKVIAKDISTDIDNFEKITYTDPNRQSNGHPLNAPKVTGSENPKVKVHIFADLTERYTKQFFNTTFNTLKEKHGQDTQFIFHHYPFLGMENAIKAGMVGECAAKQGQFWTNIQGIMDNTDAIDSLDYLKSVKVEEIRKCLQDPEVKLAVTVGEEDAKYVGLNAVPSFIIQNAAHPEGLAIKILGAQDIGKFDRAIAQKRRN